MNISDNDMQAKKHGGDVVVHKHHRGAVLAEVMQFVDDLKKLVKMRLTMTVVFSASIAFLIGSKQQGDINWINWLILTLGGFLVTGSANGFNEIIERDRSEEHTSELQSLMRLSYAVFCLKKKTQL